jgi:hypothetical protein
MGTRLGINPGGLGDLEFEARFSIRCLGTINMCKALSINECSPNPLTHSESAESGPRLRWGR